jgi:hypothetical protein
VSIVFCFNGVIIKVELAKKIGVIMKTESIRARTEDAKILKQECRVMSAELQRQVPVSELINGLMEYLESAKEKIKNATD